jgi:hypothetical protein
MSSISKLEKEKEIKLNLDFILSHFEEPLFPRTISTKTTEGRQIFVNSKDEALARFKQAGYKDCRINAFPSYIEHRGKIIQKSNFIFIDIDKEHFDTEEELDRAVRNCLKMIDKRFHVHPTILYTGSGYHIYLPIEGIVLEDYSDLSRFGQISQKFLKFAAIHLSSNACDPNNNPSLKSCLLRVPSTINSKCDIKVKIIQRWNGIRPKFSLITGDFMAYLVDEKIGEERRLRRELELSNGNSNTNTNSNTKTNYPIPWIEALLNIPIDDYRKNAIALILAPYLVTIRGFNFEQAHETISSWLAKCNKLRRLDFNANRKVNEAINNAIVKKTKPMRLETLRNKDENLYHLVITLRSRRV